ncbi:hypothetical protein ACOSP7_024681 [Xanthoceras sorbifolium]
MACGRSCGHCSSLAKLKFLLGEQLKIFSQQWICFLKEAFLVQLTVLFVHVLLRQWTMCCGAVGRFRFHGRPVLFFSVVTALSPCNFLDRVVKLGGKDSVLQFIVAAWLAWNDRNQFVLVASFRAGVIAGTALLCFYLLTGLLLFLFNI